MANYWNSTFEIKSTHKRLQQKTGLKSNKTLNKKSKKCKNIYGPRKKRLQQRVFERDNYRCVNCGEGIGLEAHHLFEGLKQNDERAYILEGVVALCYKCHRFRWHSNDTKWKKEMIEKHGWKPIIEQVKRGEGTIVY